MVSDQHREGGQRVVTMVVSLTTLEPPLEGGNQVVTR